MPLHVIPHLCFGSGEALTALLKPANKLTVSDRIGAEGGRFDADGRAIRADVTNEVFHGLNNVEVSPQCKAETSRSLHAAKLGNVPTMAEEHRAQVYDEFVAGLKTIMAEKMLKPSPLAKQAGLSVTAIRDLYRKGSSPKISTAQKIAKALGMSIDDVIERGRGKPPTRVENGRSPPPGANLVPVYDVAASAGFGAVVEAEEHIYNLAFDNRFLRQMTNAKPGDLAIITVKGHSMEPTLIDDDQVLVDRSKTNLSFDGLFVLRFDDALHVKRIGRSTTNGQVLVISDHPSYPTLDMPKGDLDVIGRVLWYGRKV